jgi:hypothetical protein
VVEAINRVQSLPVVVLGDLQQRTPHQRWGLLNISIYELPRETVWKIETGPIVEPYGRAKRDQNALFGRLTLPETIFVEFFRDFPDSF